MDKEPRAELHHDPVSAKAARQDLQNPGDFGLWLASTFFPSGYGNPLRQLLSDLYLFTIAD